MIQLGIAESHCSSAYLMVDGRIVGMIQEERLTKRKIQVACPKRAIDALIDGHLDGDPTRLDGIVLAERTINPYAMALDRFCEFSVADHVAEQHAYWHPHFYDEVATDRSYWQDEFVAGRFLNRDHNHDLDFIRTMAWDDAVEHFNRVERAAALTRHLGWSGPTARIDHHECHAYYALYGSAQDPAGYGDTLVLTADGWGEDRNWSAWLPDADNGLGPVASGAEHLVSRIYKFVTLILGMKPNEHEYKVMGLAPYSRSRRHVEASERVFFEALDFRDGAFVSDRPLADSYFDLKDRLEGHRFDNIAAALQNWASALTCAWARHWLRGTDRRRLCFSGGLSMNIRINGDLLNLPEVDHLSVPASGGDESLCAGACFAHEQGAGRPVEPMAHVCLGCPADSDGWTARLGETPMGEADFGMREGVDADAAARLLAADCILARCVGPAEFGARSLGNRAILADPSNPENVKRINEAIKQRDFWMPFTPSILAEHASDYLDNPKGVPSPYMTIGYGSSPARRSEIVGGLHLADHSARPQFVARESNPGYWALIEAFRAATGIAALLNTSLNLHGEPMNYTVADAVRTVALSDLEFLLLPGDRLLFKRRAEPRLRTILDSAAGAA